MSMVNHSMDRAMRLFVGMRMRPQLTYSAERTALILVAAQRGLLGDNVANMADLARLARSSGVTVIHAPLGVDVAGSGCRTPAQQAILDAAVIQSESPGADIHPDLAAVSDIVLEPFTALSAFANPALSAALASHGVDRVIVAGARTEIEIDSTARDATEAGLHTTVVSDCCRGATPRGHQTTIGTTLPRLVHAVLTLDDLSPLLR